MGKCCGTCKWFDFPANEVYGRCKDAIVRAMKSVPASVTIKDYQTTPLAPFAGTECPCWEAK
jgi:formaldehyde-activating enzyme involved in methanogenesis